MEGWIDLQSSERWNKGFNLKFFKKVGYFICVSEMYLRYVKWTTRDWVWDGLRIKLYIVNSPSLCILNFFYICKYDDISCHFCNTDLIILFRLQVVRNKSSVPLSVTYSFPERSLYKFKNLTLTRHPIRRYYFLL